MKILLRQLLTDALCPTLSMLSRGGSNPVNEDNKKCKKIDQYSFHCLPNHPRYWCY